FHRERTIYGKAPGLSPAKSPEMSPASQLFADFVSIGSHIKTFAADDPKIYLLGANFPNFMRIDMNESRFAIHNLAFTGQFVEWNALLLNGGDHGRSLVKVTVELCERGDDQRWIKKTHLVGFDDYTVAVLSIRYF